MLPSSPGSRSTGPGIDIGSRRSDVDCGTPRSTLDGTTERTWHERCQSTRRYPKRRVRPHLGRQAHTLGRDGPALRRLGDVPPEGLAGGPEPDLRCAAYRL